MHLSGDTKSTMWWARHVVWVSSHNIQCTPSNLIYLTNKTHLATVLRDFRTVTSSWVSSQGMVNEMHVEVKIPEQLRRTNSPTEDSWQSRPIGRGFSRDLKLKSCLNLFYNILKPYQQKFEKKLMTPRSCPHCSIGKVTLLTILSVSFSSSLSKINSFTSNNCFKFPADASCFPLLLWAD